MKHVYKKHSKAGSYVKRAPLDFLHRQLVRASTHTDVFWNSLEDFSDVVPTLVDSTPLSPAILFTDGTANPPSDDVLRLAAWAVVRYVKLLDSDHADIAAEHTRHGELAHTYVGDWFFQLVAGSPLRGT